LDGYLAEFLKNAFLNFRIADLFDIAVVAVILYFILVWIRRRASRSAVISLVSVLVLYSCAHVFDMYLTSMLFKAGLTVALVALVLVYQEDLRMAVEHLSSWGAYRSRHALVASSKTIECLVESSVNLARDRIGALIVIKGRDSLDRHLSGGIALNGRVSMPLLYSIFHPATPSHDGALIIEADRIEHFGVRLPLSHNSSEVGSAGTRHTAGLGLSERSDALVIIVSEERGIISIAENGHLDKVSVEQLCARLDNFYGKIFPEPEKNRRRTWITKNLPMKLTSVGFALLLWTVLAFKIETVSRTFTVPVECRNIPQYCVVENPHPMEVQVSVSGVERAFTFNPASLAVSIDIRKTVDGTQIMEIDENDISVPAGIRIQQIAPRSITVSTQRFCQVDLPVNVRYCGELKSGIRIADARVQPSTIRLLVPERKRKRFVEIPTEPLAMDQISGNNATFRLKLVPPSGTRLLNENDDEVRATIGIEKK
jgi:diadenylate cyclase